jgi:hypothetical protein
MMKLSAFYEDILLEAKRNYSRLNPPLFLGKQKYLIYQTSHQYFDRNGNLPEITPLMWSMISDETYKSGIPGIEVWKSIKRKLPKIVESFENKGKKRLLFIEKRLMNEGNQSSYFYFEYVLDYIKEKYDRKLIIVTSAITPEGKFLENKKDGTEKVLLERLGLIGYPDFIIL